MVYHTQGIVALLLLGLSSLPHAAPPTQAQIDTVVVKYFRTHQ